MNILRDAAQLQTQLRLYDALVETRHTLLKLRPTLRQHWLALAVAYHLSGNLQEAKKVLEHYERTLKVGFFMSLAQAVLKHHSINQNVPDYDVEHSETTLYHVRILEDLGEYSEALTLLDVNAKSRAIVDKTAIMEIRGVFSSSTEMSHFPYIRQLVFSPNLGRRRPNMLGEFLSSITLIVMTITEGIWRTRA